MRWLPNILTLLRLPLAAGVVWSILGGRTGLALVLLALAGLSDSLDGYLARRLGAVSRLGTLIDPVADKALLVSTFLTLGVAGLVPMWLVWMVLARDVLILAVGGLALLAGRGRALAPSVWGKLSTVVQVATGLAALLAGAFPVSALARPAEVLPVAAAVTTAWSGLHYAWRARRLFAADPPSRAVDAPLRVLLVAPSPRFVGGQSAQAASLLRCLGADSRLRVDLQHVDPDLWPGLRWLRRVKYLRTAVNLTAYTARLAWRLPHYSIAHVFTPGLTAYLLTALPALILGRVFGRSVIINYHDGRVEDHLRSSRIAVPTLRWASAVVTPSEFVAGVFRAHGVEARCIHNVIDPSAFRYRQRGRLRPVFLTNRMLDPLYNVDCVLRAFAIIQEEYPGATLTVAHDGPCRRRLERLAAELGLRQVTFTGHVAAAEMPALYDAADIYLMSPWRDCMPLTLLECFASGLPAVATRVGGVPYLMEHERTGLLVEPGDHQAMAACALRLLREPELVERITAAARAALHRYSCSAVVPLWGALYAAAGGPGTMRYDGQVNA